MTFRDRLIGFSPTQVEDDPYDGISEDDKGDRALEDDIYCPILKVTNEEKRRLPKPWRHSLIIKLMGRPIGYKTLL